MIRIRIIIIIVIINNRKKTRRKRKGKHIGRKNVFKLTHNNGPGECHLIVWLCCTYFVQNPSVLVTSEQPWSQYTYVHLCTHLCTTSCHVKEFCFASVISGFLMMDLNLQSNFCKAALLQCLLLKARPQKKKIIALNWIEMMWPFILH